MQYPHFSFSRAPSIRGLTVNRWPHSSRACPDVMTRTRSKKRLSRRSLKIKDFALLNKPFKGFRASCYLLTAVS